VYRSVNFVLLETYWNIGKLIVEEEQQGESRAVYGSNLLKNFSKELTLEFGKGFDYTNLTNMRKFYFSFPILDAMRQELSWTHYRILSKIDSEEKRRFYLNEAAENSWNSGQLERQIKSLSFERTLKPNPNKEELSIHSVLSDNNTLFASQYMLYMPKEEDLKQIIDQDRIIYELNKNS
jgi:hypothetical protein